MKFQLQGFIGQMFFKSSQAATFIALAMLLGGPKVRDEFSQMTSDLVKVSSKVEFAEWLVRSQFRLIDLVTIDWKPISVFPEEAKRFK